MRKVRNAVIIIILCLIGAYSSYKTGGLGLLPSSDHLRDAVAGNGRSLPTNAGNGNPNLHMSDTDADSLHDSVAGNAVPGFGGGNIPGAPRGSTDGGFGSFSRQNPNSQNSNSQNGSNPLSPSGPASPSSPPK